MTTQAPRRRPTSDAVAVLGQHFTPAVAAEFLWQQLFSCLPQPRGAIRVADPAAGEGALLCPPSRLPADEFCGVERDPRVAERGVEAGIWIGDGLFDDRLEADSFDVVVANPPFGRASDLLDEDQWARLETDGQYSIWGAWESGAGDRFASRPVEHLFVERCLQLISVGGYAAIILPDGMLANHRVQAARDWILTRADPVMVIALPNATFRRPGLNAMAHLVLLRRRPVASKPGGLCLMVQRPDDRRGRLISSMAKLEQDLTDARQGKQLPHVSRVEVTQLAGQRWDPGFWHGQQNVPLWDSGLPEAPLGEFIEHLTYGPIVTGSRAAHDPQGILSIRQGDFTDSGLQLGQALRVENKGDHDPARSRVQFRDLLMPRSGAGALGRNRLAVYTGPEPANVGCFVDLIRLGNINPFYVWLFLRSRAGWAQIRAAFNGVGTPNINFTEIRALRIPLLPDRLQSGFEKAYLKDVLPMHTRGENDPERKRQAAQLFGELVQELDSVLVGTAPG